jgi:hypothetical protein
MTQPGQLQTSARLAQTALAVKATNTMTLEARVTALRHSRSADPVQRMQADAVVGPYGVEMQTQNALAPLFGAIIPDVSSARDAAAKSSPALKGYKRL